VKGASSGSTQELLAVDLDCDDDALRFTVQQHGIGFCHTGVRSCWDTRFSLGQLERVIAARATELEPRSGTQLLLNDPELLTAKLLEEAGELGAATTPEEVIHETADLLYFALVRLRQGGAALAEVETELGRRSGQVRRRPMTAKVMP
jgi:phosphoribosyl-ATP pyrophosphohydrolase